MANAALPIKSKTSGRARKTKRGGRDPRRRARRAEIHPLDRAIAELRNELARSPDDALLYGRLGALQYRRGDLREAEGSYRKAIQLQPGRASFHNNLGNVLCDVARMREGIACYERAIAIEEAASPDNTASQESRVNLELSRLEYRIIHERIEYLERAVSLDVESADALNALGGGYLLCQQREKALAAFRRAAKLNPRNIHAARNIAFAHSLDLAGPDDMSSALAEIAQCAVRFPKEPRLFIHEGELLESAGLLESAEEKYVRAVKADPRNLEAYDLLGRLRAAMGMVGEKDETARVVDAAIRRLDRDGRKRATTKRRKATVSATLDSALMALATARFNHEPIADREAVDVVLRETLDRADMLKSRDREAAIRATVLRTQLLEAEGDIEEAGETLRRMSEKAPNAARIWFERGGLAYRCGEISVAVDAFERATLLDPQEAFAYQSLRFAFDGYRRYRTERVRFEYASRVDPRDALAHHHMGLAAMSVLKNEEALLHFSQALELDPRLAEAACGCARVHQRRGDLSASASSYRQALSIDANCQEARVALQQLAQQTASTIFLQDSPESGRNEQK